MFKYFKRYSSSYKTTIYYCQIDGWNYFCAEYRSKEQDWVGCFYDFIEIDWKEWKEKGELPKKIETLPQSVIYKMIECIIA